MKYIRFTILFLATLSFFIAPTAFGGAGARFQKDTTGTLTTGLQAYWNMNEATATTRFDFYSTKNLTDTNSVASVAGKVGNASDYTFASSQFLTAGNVAALDNPALLSIAFCLKMSSSTSQFGILGKFKAGPNAGYKINHTVGHLLYFEIDSDDTHFQSVNSIATIDDGAYHAIVVTWNGTADALSSGMKIYVDNVDSTTAGSGSTTIGSLTNTVGFDVGRNNSTAPLYFTGDVDELGFWTKVLTATEISNLYNGGACQTMVSSSDDQILE